MFGWLELTGWLLSRSGLNISSIDDVDSVVSGLRQLEAATIVPNMLSSSACCWVSGRMLSVSLLRARAFVIGTAASTISSRASFTLKMGCVKGMPRKSAVAHLCLYKRQFLHGLSGSLRSGADKSQDFVTMRVLFDGATIVKKRVAV